MSAALSTAYGTPRGPSYARDQPASAWSMQSSPAPSGLSSELLRPAEVERLLALALPPRERVLRAILFGTGLRATPICGLRVGDVNETPPQLRALVKGRKVQVVPIAAELRDLIVATPCRSGASRPTSTCSCRRRPADRSPGGSCPS